MDFRIEPAPIRDGETTVPGDKSISHRALMLAGIADGRSHISGFLAGEDCLATLAALQALGVRIEREGETGIVVDGVGRNGLSAPPAPLDLGNSGTAMRLMAGLLAGQAFDTTLTGDASLCGRPMGRIVEPLTAMGAVVESDCDGTPPLQIRGGMRLRGIDYALPVASAQVKSCLLLAGLYADGRTTITEPAVTRDHTERMMAAMGVALARDGQRIAIGGGQRLCAADIAVPADLSSAAFVLLAAVLGRQAEVVVHNVGVNPTRTGVIDILRAMGAELHLEHERAAGGEPVADIRVRASELRAIDVDPSLVSLAIDEFPVLFVAAAAARGETRFRGIAELRVKESDRIAAMAGGLRSLGIDVAETGDGATVTGGSLTGGIVDSHGDHRVAMALCVAGSIATGPVTVRGVDNVDTSFPGFADCLRSLGLRIAAGNFA